jgi:hypothetical protein
MEALCFPGTCIHLSVYILHTRNEISRNQTTTLKLWNILDKHMQSPT